MVEAAAAAAAGCRGGGRRGGAARGVRDDRVVEQVVAPRDLLGRRSREVDAVRAARFLRRRRQAVVGTMTGQVAARRVRRASRQRCCGRPLASGGASPFKVRVLMGARAFRLQSLVRAGQRDRSLVEVVVGEVAPQPLRRVARRVDRDEDGQHVPSGAVEAVEHLGHLPCVRGSKGAE